MSRGRALPEENMSTAYKVLPSMLYLVYWAFRQRKLIHGLLVALSGLLVFLFGTRGPVVVFLVYLAVELYPWAGVLEEGPVLDECGVRPVLYVLRQRF